MKRQITNNAASKKTLTVSMALVFMITGAMGVNVIEVTTDPVEPRYGDSPYVNAFIDGEGREIQSARATVRENGEIILNEEPLTLETGRMQDVSYWRTADTFNVSSADSETFTYDVTVQAIDTQGESSSFTFEATVKPNATITEDETNPDSGYSPEIFGIRFVDIIVMGLLLMFGYSIFYKE